MENKKILLDALNTLMNDYDAYMMMNRYSWEEGKNSHAKEFKTIIDANLIGEKVKNAIMWIHDCYDCYYKNELETVEDNAFNYLRGVIENGIE